MPVQLIYRKPHTRRLKTGETVSVAGSWMIKELKTKSHGVNHFTHDCPMCGGQVRSVRMPNGGWVHYEALGGLRSVKHPCFYVGEDVSHGKDPYTMDLFEDAFPRREIQLSPSC